MKVKGSINITDEEILSLNIGFVLKRPDGREVFVEPIRSQSLRDVIFRVPIINNAITMYVKLDPSVGKHIFFYGIWEHDFTQEFINRIKETDKDCSFIDVGSQYGYFSLLFSHLRNDGHIICFEPDIDNYGVTELNLMFHPTKHLICCALGDRNETVPFYRNLDSSAQSSLNKDKCRYDGEQIEETSCFLRTLSSFDNIDFKRVQAIKIDAQGQESIILKDAYDILEKGTHIFVEQDDAVDELVKTMNFAESKLVYPNWCLVK